MFLGHFAVAFAAKRVDKTLSLGTTFLAAQFLDLLWPTLLFMGTEQALVSTSPGAKPPLEFTHYPYSHSLAMVAVWALLAGIVHYQFRRHRRSAVVIGCLVLSHWFLDLLVHVPDLPLYPGSAGLGLGLWSFWALENSVEVLVFAAAVWLYTGSTRARDAAGHWGLWSLVALMFVIQLANSFGPPPPSITAVAWAGQAQWLLVVWAYWIDRHRDPLAGGTLVARV